MGQYDKRWHFLLLKGLYKIPMRFQGVCWEVAEKQKIQRGPEMLNLEKPTWAAEGN